MADENDPQPVFGAREAVTLDGALEKAGMGGWQWLEKLFDPAGGQQAGELEGKAVKIAPILYALALSEEGRQLLEWLCDITIRRQHFVPGTSIEQAGIYAIARGSQDGLIFVILKTIMLGQEMAKGRHEPLEFKKPEPKGPDNDTTKPAARKRKPRAAVGARRRKR